MSRIKCLNPKCKSRAVTRGLCQACYSAIQRQIKVGRVTWDIVQNAGKSLPLRIRDRKGDKKAWVLEGVIDKETESVESATARTGGFADIPE